MSRGRIALCAGAASVVVVLVYVIGIYPWFVARGRPIYPSERAIALGKAAVGVVALAGWAWSRHCRRGGNPLSRRVRRLGVTAGCALAILAWLNFGVASGWPRYVHTWDVFHYYVGSKYSAELGYTELYRCSVVAASETSVLAGNSLAAPRIRNLESAGVERAADVLAHPELCKSRFSGARWADFQRDVTAFKARTDTPLWRIILMDHGYQPPPVWTMVGGSLARLVPSTDAGLLALASIDVALLAGAFALLYWAFGLRVLWTGLVFYGCQWPSNAFFLGGTFLRYDWFFASVAAMCLAARRRWALSGIVLAFAILVRVVPVFCGVAWVVLLVVDRWSRRPEALRRHLAFGRALVAGGLAIAALSAAVVGPSAYGGFVRSITLHARTPLVEQMGLPTIFSYTVRGRADQQRDILLPDQFQEWRRERLEALHDRRLVFRSVDLAIVALAALFLRRRGIWVALALGPILCAAFADVACYYYAFFVLLAPFARASPRFGAAMIGLGIVSSGVIAIPALSAAWDDRFVVQSLIFVGFALLMLLVSNSRNLRRDRSKGPAR